MMKLLILLGAGYISYHMVRYAQETNHEVETLARIQSIKNINGIIQSAWLWHANH